MKTWFITGASRGFGRAVAEEAIARGDRVAATARKAETLQPLVAKAPDRVLALPLDVTDAAQIKAATDAALDRFGAIDVLYNNAGIGYFAAVEESDETEVRRLMEINLFGLAKVTNALLPHMRERRSGTILNMSSVGGVRSFPAVGWYCASKFAVEGLSETLDQEVSPLGINVVLVEPGPFATDWAGNSANETKPDDEIDDYRNTAGKQRQNFRDGLGDEPGDPKRGAKVLLDIVHGGKPPKRLPLGSVSYDGILEKFDNVRDDIAPHETVIRSADRT